MGLLGQLRMDMDLNDMSEMSEDEIESYFEISKSVAKKIVGYLSKEGIS